mgnify:CR=1 FL=1
MITCSDAVKRLWEYLDATVDQATREAGIGVKAVRDAANRGD